MAALRRVVPILFVLVVVAALFVMAKLPSASAATRSAIASRYAFRELPIALPPGLPDRQLRTVNPQYEHIRSWISSVGAGIAVNDLDGQGGPNDLCVVDTRSDSVIITPAPDSGADYAPFVLDPAPLPMGGAIAPMGCTPGDFNSDGRMDLLVTYWGRTPILFLQRSGVRTLSNATYVPQELTPQARTADGSYHGPLWNTNAVSIADFDGDGKTDIGVFNYFPDSQVLAGDGQPNVTMNHSMSHAVNGGGAHIMHWTAATSGADPSVTYTEQPTAIPPAYATGWTLAAASADLDGDLLPELYVANDFGNDRFFHNVSTPGHIRFTLAQGRRGVLTPKSLVLGHDSFKSMGVDFADLSGNGRFDMFVSNITVSWGLEESNFYWENTARTLTQARSELERGDAPFDNAAAARNIAWSGWGWDAKAADFDNSGHPAIVQTEGFVKGTINRFNWLQELAMGNDVMLANPDTWPNARPGDDIAGSTPAAFWAPEANGRFVNIGPQLGITDTTPTRGVAIADTNGDGMQDFALARQWGAPVYYRNAAALNSHSLDLRLYRPATGEAGGDGGGAGVLPGAPAYGAVVRITTADGRDQLSQLDGGGGGTGKRSFDVFFGLGSAGDQPVRAEISWLDTGGAVHHETLSLAPGRHDLMLTTRVQELTTS